MLKKLKKIVVLTALFATVVTQAPLTQAFTTSGGSTSSASGTSSSSSSANNTGAQYCNVYGCTSNSSGSTGTGTGTSTGGYTGGSTGSSSGTANTTGTQHCNVFGCLDSSTGGTTGSTGSTGSTTGSKAANSTGAQYCNVYGCTGANSGTGGTGTGTGTGTGSTNNGYTPAKPTGSQYCNVYGCTSANPGSGSTGSTGTGSTNNGYTPANPTGSQYCNVYGCDAANPAGDQYCNIYNCNPGYSLCNNHLYPIDIDGHWAEIYIRRLYDLCIVEGYSDGTFRPEQSITRAELTKMALYAAGIQPNPGCYDADCGSPFMDLDAWQGQWIRPAWDRRIVQGYPDGSFRPNQSITREEATKIILSAYGYGPLSTDHSFFNDVSGWSTGWIEQAHQLGIVSGIGNGNFDPQRPITRAEAAKIIAKSIEKEDTKITAGVPSK